MVKYPRTPHIKGSRKQIGDDLADVDIKELQRDYLVLEEKIDGSNTGISFDDEANLILQSRGHTLNGGPRERQFNLFKSWANSLQNKLWDILGDQYIMYGEWLYAKHTVFYDQLEHYFMEFDIFDKRTHKFLSTKVRHEMLDGSGIISVPVLATGQFQKTEELEQFIGPSKYKSKNWLENLKQTCQKYNLSITTIFNQTDLTNRMEGLYIKQEDDNYTIGRYKYIRSDFLQQILDSGTHWMDRPILPNQLAPVIDIFTTYD